MQPNQGQAVTASGIAPRKYSILKFFHDGHVFLRENATGRIAIGDQSGVTESLYGRITGYNVERCDDGVLWLDVTRPVELIRYAHPNQYDRYYVSIPLLDRSGHRTATIGTAREAAWCNDVAQMEIVSRGADYSQDIGTIIRRGWK